MVTVVTLTALVTNATSELVIQTAEVTKIICVPWFLWLPEIIVRVST